MNTQVTITADVVWPVVTFILILSFILRFTPSIKLLFPRLRSFVLGKFKAEFYQGEGEATEAARREAQSQIQALKPAGTINWSRTGDLFWLGNDLMWAKAATIGEAPKSVIIDGLENAIAWLQALGLSGTHPEDALKKLIKYLLSVGDFDRNDFASQIEAVKQYVAGIAEQHQRESP